MNNEIIYINSEIYTYFIIYNPSTNPQLSTGLSDLIEQMKTFANSSHFENFKAMIQDESKFMRLLKTLKLEIFDYSGNNRFHKYTDITIKLAIYRSKTIDSNLLKYVLKNNIRIYFDSPEKSENCKIQYSTSKYSLNPKAPPLLYYPGSIRDYINENIHFKSEFLKSINLTDDDFKFETRLTKIDDVIAKLSSRIDELSLEMKNKSECVIDVGNRSKQNSELKNIESVIKDINVRIFWAYILILITVGMVGFICD